MPQPKNALVLHPLFFAAYPVLALYQSNIALFPAQNLIRPLAVLFACVLTLWGFLWLFMRSGSRAAAVVSVAVLMFFTYHHVWHQIETISMNAIFGSEQRFFEIWTAITLILMFLVGWKAKASSVTTRFLNVFALLLMLIPSFAICSTWYRANKIYSQSDPEAPAQATVKVASMGRPPDIYYIILDGFGRQDALQKFIGYSDADFIQGLQQRGFYVANNAHSNYCQTELSLASSLNYSYLEQVVPKQELNTNNRLILDKLIDKSAASKYLKKQGYLYVGVGSGGPMIHMDSADILRRPDSSGLTYFETSLIQNTPVAHRSKKEIGEPFESKRKQINSGFQHLAQSAGVSPVPRFVFCHIFAPHPPFVFNADGSAAAEYGQFGIGDGNDFYALNKQTRKDYCDGYANQAKYIARQTLAAIDSILRKSSPPPIIILQGDHGSKSLLDQESLEKTDIRECFSNLNAYYVPADIKQRLYPSITPVNSFRLVFNSLFNANLPLLPDKSYYTTWSEPYAFQDVDNKLLQNKASTEVAAQ
jgi:hypothetical protein